MPCAWTRHHNVPKRVTEKTLIDSCKPNRFNQNDFGFTAALENYLTLFTLSECLCIQFIQQIELSFISNQDAHVHVPEAQGKNVENAHRGLCNQPELEPAQMPAHSKNQCAVWSQWSPGQAKLGEMVYCLTRDEPAMPKAKESGPWEFGKAFLHTGQTWNTKAFSLVQV